MKLLAALALLASVLVSPQAGFKVLAFYNGTWDPAHISFVKEANPWFGRAASENGFTYESTTNWNRLTNAADISQYQVLIFLDDHPQNTAQRNGFQQYMNNGGGWLGFHVSAFTQNAGEWPWYHNQFLGTGNFVNNTWEPTTAELRVENRTHPSTVRLPERYTSSVSEWYGWSNDLRQNPNIQVLASVAAYPLGTDPNQTWRGGYHPIMWTNKNYKMLYANFGHNAMDYPNNLPRSSTFASETQNRFLIDGLLWLGGGGSPIETKTITTQGGKCVDVRAAGTANGTAVQQYTCNSTAAQQFQVSPTSDGYSKVATRNDLTKVLDVSNVSTSDGAVIHLWTYGGGANQQWRLEPVAGGYQRIVSRHSGKCLTAPGNADGVQLEQRTCDGGAAQSFRLA
ncbi:ThuA domain-containing protein [Lentzea tibetensis]|uniref:ThuA domain-containing protein n=1 Tax=Lentzea tibetensis TaxID=2591470 RepID=UPI001F1E4F56|nr:ThuA domain-containing protein [Lentzea tibetensis]